MILIRTLPTTFVCTSSRSAVVPVAVAMIGLIVLLLIPVRRLVGEIREDSIILELFVLNSVKEIVAEVIIVSLHMGCLNVGFTQHDTGLKHAKMGKTANVRFVSLHILHANFVFCHLVVTKVVVLVLLQGTLQFMRKSTET